MVLGGIAIAMLAYILVFERGSLTTGELESRRGRVIETFVRAHVTRMEITAGETHVVLTRAEEQGEETLDTFGVGDWSMEAPVHADAEGESVDGLMSTLEWLDARRTIEGIGQDDRERFGMEHPQATVSFTVAGESHTVRVGGEDPRGEGLYVTIDEGDTAWIVGRDLLEALQHDADHYRSKTLFPHFRERDARVLELSHDTSHVRVERDGADGHAGPWRLTQPVEALPRATAVDALIHFAVHARATRFLSEEPGSELGTPSRELRIERVAAPDDAAEDESDRSPLRIRVLGGCPDHEDELTAVVNDGPVVCILASDVAPLDLAADNAREPRIVAIADDRVESITLAHGEAAFTVMRSERGFRVQVPGAEPVDADDQAVGDLMEALRGEEAQEWVGATDELLAQHGFTTPTAVLTIERTDDGPAEVVTLGALDAAGVWARRGDERQLGRFSPRVRELFLSDPVAFRRRGLVEREADDATEVRITRGTATETVVHRDDGWHVTEPAELVADDGSVRDVARAMGGLTALRFVAPHAAPEHGLDHPRYAVSVHFAAPDEHEHGDAEDDEEDDESSDDGPIDVVLHVGAATEGGAFATFGDDPAVLVVGATLVEMLGRPLASRDLLAVPTGDVSAVTIRAPGSTVSIHESGDGWATDVGPAASGPATAMLDRLASLHAIGVEPYGTAMPAALITIEASHRAEGSSVTRIEIGPVVEGSDPPYRLARIGGVAAVFRIQDADATAFAEYRP